MQYCTVNWSEAALLETHINKGWPSRPVIDARARTPITKELDWYRGKGLAGKTFGRYISMMRVQTDLGDYPPEAIAHNRLIWGGGQTFTWGTQSYVDIRIGATLDLWINLLVEEILARPAPLVFGDNIIHRSATSSYPIPWELTLKLMSEVQRKVQSKGITMIYNIACALWGMKDEEYMGLLHNLYGLAFETTVHPSYVRPSPQLMRVLIQRHRRIEAPLVFMSVNTQVSGDDAEKDLLYTAAYGTIISEADSNILVGWPFFKPLKSTTLPVHPEEWPLWEPLADFVMDEKGSLRRPFRTPEGRTVVLVAKNPAEVEEIM